MSAVTSCVNVPVPAVSAATLVTPVPPIVGVGLLLVSAITMPRSVTTAPPSLSTVPPSNAWMSRIADDVGDDTTGTVVVTLVVNVAAVE